MLSTRRLRVAAGLAVAALVAVVAVSTGTSASATATIVIWADTDRVPAVTQVANAWADRRARPSRSSRRTRDIRSQLTTVAAETAPDVIVGAHDWVGQLSANGSVLPLSPSAATRKQFPAYALNAFSYGTAVKKLYGVPVALENVGLIINTRLAKVPTTFADLEKQALAAKKKTKAQVGIAVQQGSGGDAYHMYPFFSGLGGYVFGTNKAGNLDPSDIGVANPKFLKNAALIDRWNKDGLISSKVDHDTAKNAVPEGQGRLLGHRPVGRRHASRSRASSYTISAFPKIVRVPSRCRSSACRASWSRSSPPTHGVESLAKDLVANYMMRPRRSSRSPRRTAASRRTRRRRAGQGPGPQGVRHAPSVGGVPMPNIPQMASVWGDLGAAWVKSTKGAGAIPARRSFIAAQKNIAHKIG